MRAPSRLPLAERTIEDYRWALELHLLPFFSELRLDEITAQEVDRYKATNAAEGALSANSINKTFTRLVTSPADGGSGHR